MTQIKLNSSLDSVSSNVSVNPSVLFEKEKMVNQESGKVLLLTGITGLGYNLAPHFGMYQIHNYLKHHNLSSEMYDRDLEFFKRTSFTEKEVIENISKGDYDVIGISVAHNKAYGEQRMCLDLDLIWKMRIS